MTTMPMAAIPPFEVQSKAYAPGLIDEKVNNPSSEVF